MRQLVFVDDNEVLLKALSTFFSKYFKVYSFSEPEEAIQYIEKNSNRIDIVIADFKMPVLSGIDVLRKSKEFNPDTIRILLSGYCQLPEVSYGKDVYDMLLDKSILKEEHKILDIIEKISQEKK